MKIEEYETKLDSILSRTQDVLALLNDRLESVADVAIKETIQEQIARIKSDCRSDIGDLTRQFIGNE